MPNPTPQFHNLLLQLCVSFSESWPNKSRFHVVNYLFLFLYLHPTRYGAERNNQPSRNGSKGRKISGGVLAVLVLLSQVQTDTATGPNKPLTLPVGVRPCCAFRLKQRPLINQTSGSQIILLHTYSLRSRQTGPSSDQTAALFLFFCFIYFIILFL